MVSKKSAAALVLLTILVVAAVLLNSKKIVSPRFPSTDPVTDISNAAGLQDSETQSVSSDSFQAVTSNDPFSAFVLLNSGKSLDEAFESAVSKYGLGDPRLASLANFAEVICNAEPDTYDSSNKKSADPTRLWAIDRVLTLCADYNPAKYKFPPVNPNLSSILQTSGAEVAGAESLRALKEAPDFQTLFDAGQILIETGQFPFDTVLPNGQEEYGTAELMKTWAMATNLLTCNEGGGCGPNSIHVASFCSNQGCRQGSDLAAAYQQRLPNNEYRAVRAFYNWLASQRH